MFGVLIIFCETGIKILINLNTLQLTFRAAICKSQTHSVDQYSTLERNVIEWRTLLEDKYFADPECGDIVRILKVMI